MFPDLWVDEDEDEGKKDKKMYDIIFLDLDGTLLPHNKIVSE